MNDVRGILSTIKAGKPAGVFMDRHLSLTGVMVICLCWPPAVTHEKTVGITFG